MSSALFKNTNLPAEVQTVLRTVGLTIEAYKSYLHTALAPVQDGTALAPLPLEPHQLLQVVPNRSQPLLADLRAAQELNAITSRSVQLSLITGQHHIPPRHAEVVIVGAGPGGLRAADSWRPAGG